MSLEELGDLILAEFRKLRSSLYELLPADCLLKPRRILTGMMASLVDKYTLSQGLIEKEDICALCNETACPHNMVPEREARISKIIFYHESLSNYKDTNSVS